MSVKQFLSDHYDLVLVLLLTFPAVFIGREISSDWGGDFAMYISEAMQIVKGQAVTQTHYIYNEQAPLLGPAVYPVGFPLLLSPVVYFYGNDIRPLIAFMSFFILLLALVQQLFFRRFFSRTISLILVLLVIYNPWTIRFKNEILADVPFALFFLLTILLYLRKAPGWIISLSMGVAMLVKSAGLVIPVAVFAYAVFLIVKAPEKWKETAGQLVLPAVSALAGVLVINKLIFHIPSDLQLYAHHFIRGGLWHIMLSNITLYTDTFLKFFHRSFDDFYFVVLITQSVMLTMFLVGLINSKKDLLFFIFSAYLLMLFIYPYQLSGFRFLLPVFPIALYYAGNGLRFVRWNYTINKHLAITFMAIFLLGQYVPELTDIIKKPVKILPGPQEQTSREAFNFIRNNIGEDEVILFLKPRVLALYTGRDAVCNELNDSDEDIIRLLKKTGTHYLLTNVNLANPALDHFIKSHKNDLEIIWSNKKFKLYFVKMRVG